MSDLGTQPLPLNISGDIKKNVPTQVLFIVFIWFNYSSDTILDVPKSANLT